MRARQFDLIAFDWDGTLFDSTVAITRSIQLAVADVGGAVPSDERASYVIGMALMPALAYAAPDVPQEKYTELANRYRYHYFKLQEQVTLFQGVLPMLDALRERGHLLAVATGKSRRGLNEALQQADLRGVFDSSRTADETAGKPNPLMLQELMAEFGVDPERLLMIGDTRTTWKWRAMQAVPVWAWPMVRMRPSSCRPVARCMWRRTWLSCTSGSRPMRKMRMVSRWHTASRDCNQ